MLKERSRACCATAMAEAAGADGWLRDGVGGVQRDSEALGDVNDR